MVERTAGPALLGLEGLSLPSASSTKVESLQIPWVVAFSEPLAVPASSKTLESDDIRSIHILS